jgi:ubiquinone/menaquinone biosynthesis C-methylase UbiE
MVNIVRQATGSAIVDDEATRAFRHQWQAYQKLVDHDYFAHREVGAILHRQLAETVGRPFRFLDLACGDASMTVAALQETPVIEYHGIDLSGPALELAKKSVESLPCPVRLEQNDFVAAMRERRDPADVVWIGLSLHHLQTDDKRELMRAIRSVIGDDGLFLIYEPFRLEGETRAVYLERYEKWSGSVWTALDPEEWIIMWEHVRTADFPEQASVWAQLGRDAGFGHVRELFTDPAGMSKLFSYRP